MMMVAGENGQQLSTVPPGFRFHPTDEELLYYYLRKKVSYEAIELDVIREVDLNKLEPWDLKDKCRIGSGHQNEWYFFSHKDKKYPTGTRTNRATSAGFWKATGRDKGIHIMANSKRIGMRKTLVFYTGRAPHGQKTDWIMHEYRLDEDDDHNPLLQVQEDGWVVCRVFKKKSHKQEQLDYGPHKVSSKQVSGSSCGWAAAGNINNHDMLQEPYNDHEYSFDGCMQLPQLFSPESSSSVVAICPPLSQLATTTTPISLNAAAAAAAAAQSCPHQNDNNNNNNNNNISWRPLSSCGGLVQPQERNLNTTDWSFLNRLLAASDHHQQSRTNNKSLSDYLPTTGLHPHSKKFSFHPFPYNTTHPNLGSAAPDFIKFSK